MAKREPQGIPLSLLMAGLQQRVKREAPRRSAVSYTEAREMARKERTQNGR